MRELIGIAGKATPPPPCKLLDWFSHLFKSCLPSAGFLKRTEKLNVGNVIVCLEVELLMAEKMSPAFSWLEFGANPCSE